MTVPLVPTVNQAPKSPGSSFSQNAVLSMNPTYLVNNIDVFQASHPQSVSQALCTVHRYSPQAGSTVNVTSVMLFRHDKPPCRATEAITQHFSHLMTDTFILMCRITGVHVPPLGVT